MSVSICEFKPDSPGDATYQYTLLKAVVVDKPIVTLPPAETDDDEAERLADGGGGGGGGVCVAGGVEETTGLLLLPELLPPLPSAICVVVSPSMPVSAL